MKYFSICSISIIKQEQAVLFKFQSLENIIHICLQNNLFLFWFEYNIPLYTRDFWKIPSIIKIIRLLSLSWIRKGSCQSRTLDLVLCKLYPYWVVILLSFLDISDRLHTRNLPDLFMDTWEKEGSLFLPVPTLRFGKHSQAKRMNQWQDFN